MNSTRLLACSFLVLLTNYCLAENWPQFRGIQGSGASDDSHLPARWGEESNLAWKVALPGRGASSPIVWDDRIFLTAYSGYGDSEEEAASREELTLHLICLEKQSGKIVWNRSIPASSNTQAYTKRIQEHGYATGTPATDGSSVFAFFGVSGVVAYSMDGELLWQRDVGDKTAGFGSASSPVLFEDLVLVNASIESQTLFALDKRSGEVVWSKSGINKAWTTPCIGTAETGEHELIINQKGTVYGLDPKTGTELWTCYGIQDYVVPVPIVHDGIAYCLGGRQNRSLAIKLGGRGDVTDTHKLWEVTVGANVTSPVYFNGHLYWASDKAIANCLDAKTGEAIYRERLKTRARIYASMVRAGKHLLVTTRDRGVVVLSATPKYEELAINQLGQEDEMFNATPAISAGCLYLRTHTHLYCVSDSR